MPIIKVVQVDPANDNNPGKYVIAAYNAVLCDDGRIRKIDTLPATKKEAETDAAHNAGRADNETN